MKQLVLFADMEGASGIFDRNASWNLNGGDAWREYGRDCITSDALAVCTAAVDFGIDEILLYDGHFAGNPEHNIILDKLPPIVRIFDVPDRRFYWRRIRGQARQNPFGIITFGQHARHGEPNAYFPHTINSPPIKNFYANGLHIAEMGSAVLSFDNTPFLANIGCKASMTEALELSDSVITIPVKDKQSAWEPSPEETFPLIYDGVTKALSNANRAKTVSLEPPYLFSMALCDGFVFDTQAEISWKGLVQVDKAEWTAPSLEIGLELFNNVRSLIKSEIKSEK
jgi:D-aminopeptidase